MAVAAFILFLLAYVIAFAGIVLPVVPGIPLAAIAGVLAGWLVGFDRFGVPALVWLAVITVLAFVVDIAGTYIGAKVYGASKPGLWGGVLGSLIGVFVFPPFGLLIGAIVGAIAAEILAGRNVPAAIRSGVGSLLGTFGGALAKVVLLIVMGIVVFPRLL